MFYHEEPGEAPRKFWIHCGLQECGHWIQIKFNRRGGPTLKVLPKGVKFYADKTPVLLVGDVDAKRRSVRGEGSVCQHDAEDQQDSPKQ